MNPERVYIIGPYKPKNCSLHDAARIAQYNTDKAIEVGNKLIEQGHYVFIPHLSHYIHTHYSCKQDYNEWWYEEDLTFLEHWATAVCLLDGWQKSKGSKMEVKQARELSLKFLFEDGDSP